MLFEAIKPIGLYKPSRIYITAYPYCSSFVNTFYSTGALDTAPTSEGIYSHHLQRHWAVLQAQAELAIALQIVINAQEPVLLEPILAHKLSSMGLIKLNNNKATPSCQLYQLYFQTKFLPAEQQILVAKK